MSTGKKHLFKNIISLGSIQILNYVFPLISVPIISRIIGPDKFGIISYAASFVIYFTMFITYGFDLTATRKLISDSTNTELRNQLFSEVLVAKFFLFIISIFIFTVCLYTVPLLAADKKVAIFSFLNCLAIVFMQNWLFQAMQDLQKVAILNFISKLIFTVSVLLLVREKKDYFWQPVITCFTQILLAAVSFFWAYKRYSLRFVKVTVKQIGQLLWNEKTVFFSMVVISLYTTTNTVILGILKDETQVGYYTAAQRLTDIAASVISLPLTQALFPYIGSAFGKGQDKGLDAIQGVSPVIILSVLAICLCLFLAGPMVLVWFYGNSFSPSIRVFRILSFVPFITILSNLLGIQVMLNLRMDKPFFYITAVGAIIGVSLNVLMVPVLGYVGTAWNWMIVEIFIMLAMYFYLRRMGIQPFLWQNFLPSAIKAQLQPVSDKLFRRKKK